MSHASKRLTQTEEMDEFESEGNGSRSASQGKGLAEESEEGEDSGEELGGDEENVEEERPADPKGKAVAQGERRAKK